MEWTAFTLAAASVLIGLAGSGVATVLGSTPLPGVGP
jgi:hypothetical protein